MVLPSKYLIIERLGKGSFGEIYKVVDKTLSKMFAVKIENKCEETNEFKNS